jgi:hypothetical protein
VVAIAATGVVIQLAPSEPEFGFFTDAPERPPRAAA